MPRAPRSVLLIINRLAPIGGAETQLTHLAEGLAAAGHRVTVCCMDSSTSDPDELARSGIALVELGAARRLARIAAIPRLVRLARRADLVQCTMWDSSLWGRIAAILARRPVIVADHATDRSVQIATNGRPRGSWIALHNKLLDRFTFATVACAISQRPVLIGEGVAPEKIVHIPNGVPIARMLRAAAAGRGREELGLPGAGPIALQVGVFRPEKNQIGGLEAFAAVPRQVAGAHLVFVGDGPERERVERRAAELGAGGWAHFLGQRTDVSALLAHTDLMLLPSTSDAMPMAVIESLTLGVPVVASDVGDVKETVGDAGICVPVGDAGALAAACVHVFSDPELRRRMSDAARERSRAFDSTTMVKRYEALFEAACEDSDPRAAVAAVG
ncbi:MAG TPA: glycosyltransferase [Solirubrobacterales bacterium]|jgi:glycosyltransferase involved in cell wall biosynthesis|nr:glycosyltransferase [Solirubrobacterales bacterium]